MNVSRSRSRPRPLAAALLLSLSAGLALVPAGARAQVGSPNSTPEERGAIDGRSEGRMKGLEKGADLGRSQALAEAWLRGFRRGVTQPDRAWRDSALDDGRAEGGRPGRAIGLETGRERGRIACAEAFAQLRGRPPYRSEASPPPPPTPPPPRFAACDVPPSVALQFPSGRHASIDRRDCESRESPLGWDVPSPDYPDNSALRRRARDAGYEDDAMIAWIRGYQDAFRSEWDAAFRQQRDTCPAEQIRRWESDGETEGRREGARRRSCEDFARGFERGFRDGFDQAFAQGFGEGWAEAEQLHLDNPVVRIPRAVLRDETDDGVVEPGERLTAELTLVNAGLVDATGDVMRFDGVVSVAARGVIDSPLPGQSRRDQDLDLGRVDAGAPFGAGVEVELTTQHGDAVTLRETVGRPVVIESVSADIRVRDGRLVTRVRPLLRSVARRATDRGLVVGASGGQAGPGPSSDVGVVGAGETRQPELELPADPSALAETTSGEVVLRAGDTFWMRRPWQHAPRFGESVLTAAALPARSRELDLALTALSRRLAAEYDEAVSDPKLYRKLEGSSDLAALAAALPSVPAAARPAIEERLVRPLVERAETKGTPRKVRRAVRDAFGKD